jgi:hypothetical protein
MITFFNPIYPINSEEEDKSDEELQPNGTMQEREEHLSKIKALSSKRRLELKQEKERKEIHSKIKDLDENNKRIFISLLELGIDLDNVSLIEDIKITESRVAGNKMTEERLINLFFLFRLLSKEKYSAFLTNLDPSQRYYQIYENDMYGNRDEIEILSNPLSNLVHSKLSGSCYYKALQTSDCEFLIMNKKFDISYLTSSYPHFKISDILILQSTLMLNPSVISRLKSIDDKDLTPEQNIGRLEVIKNITISSLVNEKLHKKALDFLKEIPFESFTEQDFTLIQLSVDFLALRMQKSIADGNDEQAHNQIELLFKTLTFWNEKIYQENKEFSIRLPSSLEYALKDILENIIDINFSNQIPLDILEKILENGTRLEIGFIKEINKIAEEINQRPIDILEKISSIGIPLHSLIEIAPIGIPFHILKEIADKEIPENDLRKIANQESTLFQHATPLLTQDIIDDYLRMAILSKKVLHKHRESLIDEKQNSNQTSLQPARQNSIQETQEISEIQPVLVARENSPINSSRDSTSEARDSLTQHSRANSLDSTRQESADPQTPRTLALRNASATEAGRSDGISL